MFQDGCDFVCRSRSREEASAYREVPADPLEEEADERDDHLLPMWPWPAENRQNAWNQDTGTSLAFCLVLVFLPPSTESDFQRADSVCLCKTCACRQLLLCQPLIKDCALLTGPTDPFLATTPTRRVHVFDVKHAGDLLQNTKLVWKSKSQKKRPNNLLYWLLSE